MPDFPLDQRRAIQYSVLAGPRMNCPGCDVLWNGPHTSTCWGCGRRGTPVLPQAERSLRSPSTLGAHQ